ncbi:RYamide receptor-like isoform X1 [Cherax quadricarinatus]|uniref:RYamide receptor-like isoform X1 n=1 Tax=Cherax quadricarinatus TaxID=27406 RepID=UPI0023793EB5|nr:RYamide receptor-like [Cherax quadricarinatus]
MATAEFRMSNFIALSEDARNESDYILYLCSPNDSDTVRYKLEFACDHCNASEVLLLWNKGVCDYPPTPAFNASIYIFYIAILVFAVMGNCIVVYVVCSSAKMRTVTNYFIANLAVGDLWMAIFCVPFSFLSTLILKYWPFGGHLCVAVNYLQAVSVFVSAYTLVAISLDRYLAIIYPLRPRMTRFQAKVIIAVVWILSLATTLPVAIYSSLLTPNLNFYKIFGRQVCTEDWGESQAENDSRMAYSVALMLLQYFLPLAVLIFTYSRIAMVVWGKKNLGETPARMDRIARSKRKMIKMMLACVLAYTLAWLPLNLYIVLRDIPSLFDALSERVHLTLFFIVHWLAMSHTCYNPVIYFWMNSSFRVEYYRALRCFPCVVDGHLASSDGTVTKSANYCSRYATCESADQVLTRKESRRTCGDQFSLQALMSKYPEGDDPPQHHKLLVSKPPEEEDPLQQHKFLLPNPPEGEDPPQHHKLLVSKPPK